MSKRRAQLISSAEQVFAAKGYAETTMADLAEAAGVTRPTVYAYFASKDDVLAAVAESVREAFLTLQEQTGPEPALTLEITLRSYLDAWVEHYGVLAVITHQALSDPSYAKLLDDIHRRTNRRHTKFMQRLVDEGTVRPILPPAEIAEITTGTAMRFAQLIVETPSLQPRCAQALITSHHALLGLYPAAPDQASTGRPADEPTSV